MAVLHVNYDDGSQWLVSQCEVVIPAVQAQHLTALEIGERVLALLPRIPFLAETIHVWDCNPEIRTIEDLDAYLAAKQNQPRQRQKPSIKVSATPKSTKGFVYIIRGDVYYKIGRTNDPYKRLTPMLAHAPFPLETLILIPTPDMAQTERELHQRFESRHQRGEWFSLFEDDLDAIRKSYRTIDPTALRAD